MLHFAMRACLCVDARGRVCMCMSDMGAIAYGRKNTCMYVRTRAQNVALTDRKVDAAPPFGRSPTRLKKQCTPVATETAALLIRGKDCGL